MTLLWLWYGFAMEYPWLAFLGEDIMSFKTLKCWGSLVGFYRETHFELILGMRVLGSA